MARFRPLRWLGQAVRRVFKPEPSPPTYRPPSERPYSPPGRPSGPTGARVTSFYTPDVPRELADDYTANDLMRVAWLDSSTDPDLRTEMRSALRAYAEAEYDIHWDDYFDWQAWREEMGYD